MEDLISVIIPTFDRQSNLPHLLLRAIESVSNQTYLNIELIIVIDGKSESIKKNVADLSFNRENFLQIIETTEKVGGATARNIGIKNSKGSWIALLDDDDEWLPQKVEKQLRILKDSNYPKRSICFSSIIETGTTQKILPYFEWNSKMNMSEYLFARKITKRIGFIQTSSIMCSKELFIKSPFTEGLVKHQDWDWLLRTTNLEDITIIQVKEPLSFYHTDVVATNRVGSINRWRFSEEWGISHKKLMSNKGYTSFMINVVFIDLVRDKELSKKERLSLVIQKFKAIPYKQKWSLSSLLTMLRAFQLNQKS